MIGYYIHHHGRGHLSRASCVAACADEPVVALSSLPEPLDHPFAHWLALPLDPDVPDPRDAQAGGTLHWAPLDSDGYRDRMAVLAGWTTRERPRLVVVDVSVEVTTLVRLLGVPVVVVAGSGTRTDAAHTLGFQLASRVIVPWPSLGGAGFSAPGTVVHTGAFSRFDTRPVSPPPNARRVLVLLGAGGDELRSGDLAAALAATPGWTWQVLGGSNRWVDDVWDELMGADVVITHAGLGALAEVAAARRPAVVLPQPRPFDEQHDTGQRLARAGLAQVLAGWPEAARWADLLNSAVLGGGRRWERWNDGQGAARFVTVLDELRGAGRAA